MIDFYPGMGRAVAERTILREGEGWGDVVNRVAHGNSTLCDTAAEAHREYNTIKNFMGNGSLITSGRHLQHGDISQQHRHLEIFTNCSTAMTSFQLMYLLLNGSGVGRCYDDDMMLVDWDHAPNIICVLSEDHPDYDHHAHTTPREAKHKYGPDVTWITVGDSREGWGHVAETIEVLAFEKIHSDSIVILDFSPVREKNAPIKGMQGKPSSGPVPLMNAINKIAALKGARIPKWKQALHVDHYFAESVLMGGVRRSARMAVKNWRDKTVIAFIKVKRPIELEDMTMDEVIEFRKGKKLNSFLWSANNSVLVDQEFWDLIALNRRNPKYNSELAKHARLVFKTATECSYGDGTGEPGFINVDQLTHTALPSEKVVFGNKRFPLQDATHLYMDKLMKVVRTKQYIMIVNPCGEIRIVLYGGYCVIADTAPYFCETLDGVLELMRVTVRFLIRTNKMDSIYDSEVKRTNRIGVALTGVHEFAWKFWQFDFYDLINEEKSQPFWDFMEQMRLAVEDEATKYAHANGMSVPDTALTIKPSGTVSKLFGLTEGWHLMAMRFYLRWVMFTPDNPVYLDYQKRGYPTRELRTYRNTCIVGFPTAPLLSTIMPPERIVTATEATPEEQYKWLLLGEKYWLGNKMDNQISYTLKYDPDKVSFEEFVMMIKRYQSQVKACSVMPDEGQSSYEYLPEEEISAEKFKEIMDSIVNPATVEDIGREHVDCGTGGCPIDFKEGEKQ